MNGFTLEPLYRKALFKGYKKRKKQKEMRFLPYIFRKDSVSFFKRFGQFKTDKYSSEYFEISLGRVPKKMTGYWNHNLVYIQNKQICDIDYFTSFCGDLNSDYLESEFIPLSSERAYVFFPVEKISNFTIPFEQGQVTFTDDDIAPFLSSFSELNYNIDSIEVHAYASVEGDSIINELLQYKRAENIASLIQSKQKKRIELSVLTSTDWYGFTKNAAKSARWKFLSNKTSTEIDDYLKTHDPTQLEALLAPTRRGDIRIYATIPVDEKNYPYLIQRENEDLLSKLSYEKLQVKRDSILHYIEALYEFAHYLVKSDSLSPEELAKFRLPERSKSSYKLIQQSILYGYEFEDAFKKYNLNWKRNHLTDINWLYKNNRKAGKLLPALLYQLVRIKTEDFKHKPPMEQEQVQEILNIMRSLNKAYVVDSSFRKNIDKVNFDLNVMLLNEVFPLGEDLMANGMDASKCIAQLYEYYEKHDEMTDSIAIALAKCAVHYSDIQSAVGMLEPYATTDSIISYLMPLSWNHPSEEEWTDYYTYLIELSYSMNTDIWCNMFMDQCQIPFQAFDHEVLRNRFCEECMERNNMIQKMKGKSD